MTKLSTPRLSEVARHVVVPEGVTATGWPAVRDKCVDLGIRFRPWQDGAGKLILAKRADGKYAATVGGTGMSIPRQVGKTFLVGAIVFALCLLRPNLTVIWTAHRLRTAEETFGKMRVFAQRKSIAPYVLRVITGSGEEEVRFRNGSRILFGARESGFGLGFDEVDVLIFDEAQRLKAATLEDMVPATNQSRQQTGALLLFMGTPVRPTDAGEVFRRMRTEALSGDSADTGWIEFGADVGYVPPESGPLEERDWRQVAKANPSFPTDTPREAILRMRKQLGPEAFLREGLGVWDELGGTLFGPAWDDLGTDEQPERPEALGLAVELDRAWSSIAAAGPLGEHTFVNAVDRRRGTSWVVPEVARIATEHAVPVVVDGRGPASDLIDDLEAAGVRVLVAATADVQDACATFFDAVTETGSIRHGNSPDLDAAVRGAVKRRVGDRFAWGRKQSMTDVSMLEAATLAAWASGGNYDVLDSVL